MQREKNIVYVIDPDEAVDDALATLLSTTGSRLVCYRSAEAFLDSDYLHEPLRSCLLVEANLPGMGCLAFLRQLRARGVSLPVVVLTSTSDCDIAAQALKAGAVEVIEKPLVHERLLHRLHHLADRNDDAGVESSGQRNS